MPIFKIHRDETTKQAVRRRMFDLPAPAQLPPARRVVKAAERILRNARKWNAT